MRLNKYIARCGVCSRRDADKLIDQGRVIVNGKKALAGMQVDESDQVILNGKILKPSLESIVLAYYKPVGVTCSEKDTHAERLVTQEIDYPKRVTYAGRLDRDSEGLLLLSNDGDLIQNLMKGANGHEREYEVQVDIKITEDFIKGMSQGVYLKELDIKTRKCRVEKLNDNCFKIVLTQGVNRQIRRMAAEFGANVTSLKRVRIANVFLNGLKPGEYRELNDEEIRCLRLHL